jgi:signal transduction histidine kinase
MKLNLTAFLLASMIMLQGTTLTAQMNPKSDSLRKLVFSHPQEDTVKVRLLVELARTFLPAGTDSASGYFDRALSISRKLEFDKGVMQAMNGQGFILLVSNKYDEAMVKYRECARLAVINEDDDFLALVNNNIGIVFEKKGMPDSAEKYDLKSLEYAKRVKSGKRMAKAMSDLAILAIQRGEFDKALNYSLQSKEIYLSMGSTFDLMIVNMRLASIYGEIGKNQKALESYRMALKYNDTVRNAKMGLTIINNMGYLFSQKIKRYDTAILLLNQAIEMAAKLNSQDILITAHLNLGGIYEDQKDFQKAIYHFNEALKNPLIQNRNRERAAVLVNLGGTYLQLGDLGLSEKFLKQGLDIAQRAGYREFEKNAYEHLYSLESHRNNYKLANDYLSKAFKIKESIMNEAKVKKIAELEFKSELNRKTAQYEALMRKNQAREDMIRLQWLLVTGISVLLLLITALLFVILSNRNRIKKINVELDRKNKELEELNLTKDKFFSIVAHDLKSPFSSLLGLLSALDEEHESFDEESRRRVIRNLRRDSNNTYNLLVNLLDWAQMQRKPMENNPAEIELNTLVNQVFDLLKPRAEAKKQTLISEIPSDCKVFIDPMALKAMLINLINNSIKFTGEGGLIKVSFNHEAGESRICVHDNGIGIPYEMLDRLFRLDGNVKREGTDKEKGTGLGLIMCREYAGIMGGKLSVRSKQGEGASFCFTFPA